jgi:hypothetical protein
VAGEYHPLAPHSGRLKVSVGGGDLLVFFLRKKLRVSSPCRKEINTRKVRGKINLHLV